MHNNSPNILAIIRSPVFSAVWILLTKHSMYTPYAKECGQEKMCMVLMLQILIVGGLGSALGSALLCVLCLLDFICHPCIPLKIAKLYHSLIWF